jgi:hypothetical protein
VAKTTIKTLHAADFDALVKRFDKCYQCLCGIFHEINTFFEVQISHALRFILICDLFNDSSSYLFFFHLRRQF